MPCQTLAPTHGSGNTPGFTTGPPTQALRACPELPGATLPPVTYWRIEGGLPEVLRTDNGVEFCGRTMLTWAHARKQTTPPSAALGSGLTVNEAGDPGQLEKFSLPKHEVKI